MTASIWLAIRKTIAFGFESSIIRPANKTFLWADLFAGLKMQLFVYLQVVLANAAYFGVDKETAGPAGMYYCLVRDDLLPVDLPSDDREEGQNTAGLRLEGMTVQDFEAVQMADPGLSGHSKLIPVAVKANGEFYSNSPGVTAEELRLLENHLLHILRSTAEEMLQGMIAAQPQIPGWSASIVSTVLFAVLTGSLRPKSKTICRAIKKPLWNA